MAAMAERPADLKLWHLIRVYTVFHSSSTILDTSTGSKMDSSSLHNFDTLRHILIICGRNEYLVGMKRRTSSRTACKRQLSFSSLCSYLHWSQNLVQAITLILFEIIWYYLVGMKRRTNSHVAYKRDNFCFLCYVVIHNFNSLRHILIIFGKDEEEDQ